MIYIDLIECKEELINEKEKKYLKIFKCLLTFFRKKNNYIALKKTEYGDLIKIQNIKKNTLKKIDNMIKLNNIHTVCLSKKLNSNQEICNFFNSRNVKIINGKWINGYLLYDLIEFISNNKEERISEQEVSFLINKNNYLIYKTLYNIALECKNLNIITKNPLQFKSLEQKLFEQEGISLNIGNNHKKTLLNSNIIINIDYTEEELNKYNIPKYCCIININDKNIRINKKSFEGINILSLKYTIEKNFISDFKNFDDNILYESLISRNSNQENVFKQIKKDNLKIIELYGRNGIIRKKEFTKLKRININ